MTQTNPGSDREPRPQDQASIPYVETVVPAETSRGAEARPSVAHAKNGRTALAIFVVPPLLIISMIVAYWAFAIGRANNESDRSRHPNGQQDTEQREP